MERRLRSESSTPLRIAPHDLEPAVPNPEVFRRLAPPWTGFGRANRRYWAKLLSSLTLGIGFVMAIFTERRQTLHDRIAGTLVLRDMAALDDARALRGAP